MPSLFFNNGTVVEEITITGNACFPWTKTKPYWRKHLVKVRGEKLNYLHLKSGDFMTLIYKRKDETITVIVLKEVSKKMVIQ